MKCNIKFKGQQKEQTLQVVETPGPALFGRDWLSKIQLDWGEIKALKLRKTPKGGMERKEDQLLQKYESVFSEGVGTLKGHKADLQVDENCQPSFHKPRQVPYALRPNVEAELTRLEKEGILSKVEYSEWATPIVPASSYSTGRRYWAQNMRKHLPKTHMSASLTRAWDKPRKQIH